MFLKSAIAVAATITLLPLAAYAGGGGPPGPDPFSAVAPTLDSSGKSAVVVTNGSGYVYGYNMDGTTVSGDGVLSAIPNFTPQTGSTLGWPDLDGNGISDLVILGANGSFQYAYLLEDDGAGFVNVVSEGPIQSVAAGSSLLGWPDLNGDGNSDMVVQDDASGATTAYLMDGLTTTSSGAVPGLPSSGGYETKGFFDLNGDGKKDIVIQAAGGYTYAYLMDGISVTSQGAIPGAPSPFRTAGFPDLDGDGDADVVIQAAGGYAYGYLMDGTTTSSDGPVAALGGFTIIGFPDLDNSGTDDVVLQASGGFSAGILMTGLSPGTPAQVPGLSVAAGYETIGFPNLDGDGEDIVVQHSGGYTFGYLMAGTSTDSSGALPGAPGALETLGWVYPALP